MTLTIDTCISEGPYGSIQIEPDEFTISEQVLVSENIQLTFNSVENYIDVAGDIYVTVFLKDNNENVITNVDFQFDQDDTFRYNIQKNSVEGKFTFTIPASSVRSVSNFNFRISTLPSRTEINCATINVDAVSSGYGFSYSYFQAKRYNLVEGTDDDGFENAVLPPPTPTPEPLITSEINYSYYDEEYETISLNPKMSELLLPNINVINSEETNTNSRIQKNRTFNGIINESISSIGIRAIARVKDYFQEYNIELKDYINFDKNSKIFNSFKISRSYNLFPSNYENKLSLENERKKNNFPMYIKMYYQMSQDGINLEDSLADILNDSKSSQQFNNFIQQFGLIDYFYYCLINELLSKNDDIDNLKDLFNDTTNNIIYRYFVQNISLNLSSDIERNFLYLGKQSDIENYNTNNFVKTIFYLLLREKLSSSQNTLDQFNILNKQILMYEIIKKKNNQVLQRYYFINNFQSTFLNFIDTQVKYDTEYTYEIYKISSMHVASNNRTRLVRQKIDETKLRVTDLPPVIPEVTFIPYSGQDDKILINFNSGIGTYEDFAEIIENEDLPVFNNIKSTQKKRQNEKIKFKSDDLVDSFEVFRLDKKPKNFQDFNKSFKQTLITKIGNMKINSTSFVDSIKPNIKYYYIARSKDVHGNISNPTQPIEVEVINESGTIFMRKKEFVFNTDTKNVSQSMKRYLKIEPSAMQSDINLSEFPESVKSPKDVETIVRLGSLEVVPVWDKEYVLKLTSKITGKKIDIRFSFSKTKTNFNV